MGYAIYDSDEDSFIGGVFSTYNDAVEELDPRLTNCLILEVSFDPLPDDERFFVMAPGEWDNAEGPRDWFAVGGEDLGIIAYAMTEPIADSILEMFQDDPDITRE